MNRLPTYDLDVQIAALIKQYGCAAVLASTKRQAVRTGRPRLDGAELNQIASQDAERFSAGLPLIPAKTIARRWSADEMSHAEREDKITRLAKKLSPSRSYRRRAMLIAFIQANWTSTGEPQIERVLRAIESLPGNDRFIQQRRSAITEACAIIRAPRNKFLLSELAAGSNLNRAGNRLISVLNAGDETQ